MSAITRRQFAAAFGAGVTVLPLAVRAQQRPSRVIGFLNSGTEAVFPDHRLSAFRGGLNEAGFVVGRDVALEFRFANGQRDRLPPMAADLVRRRVAAIVVNGVAVPAAMAATSTIPIVFLGANDPVAQGAITSFNRPSGNVTGISFFRPGLSAKRLQILHELLSKPTAVAVLLDSSGPAFETQLRDVSAAAHNLGRQIVIVRAASEDGLETAFAMIRQAAAGAILVGSSSFLTTQRRKLIIFAAGHKLPAIYEGREFVEAGGLMSYGASAIDAYRRGGIYVGRILMGAKPSDLPVELPTRFELVINMATAKALGLDLPRNLLAQATELINDDF
jgi:putative ABC transport system substrate-binding protein